MSLPWCVKTLIIDTLSCLLFTRAQFDDDHFQHSPFRQSQNRELQERNKVASEAVRTETKGVLESHDVTEQADICCSNTCS